MDEGGATVVVVEGGGGVEEDVVDEDALVDEDDDDEDELVEDEADELEEELVDVLEVVSLDDDVVDDEDGEGVGVGVSELVDVDVELEGVGCVVEELVVGSVVGVDESVGVGSWEAAGGRPGTTKPTMATARTRDTIRVATEGRTRLRVGET